ncbi:MAG: cystathionine gamma-synthase family protein [Rubrivivax sp.]|nr:cystathionine gamma-synthase family protein [Rubrivivax sp.]
MSASDTPPTGPSLLTRLLHADRLGRPEHGAVHKPLHVAATYAFPSAGELAAVFQGRQAGHVYSRQGNPTDTALEAKLAMLEGARGAATFSTGMAAVAGVMLTLLKAGDHLVASRYLFGNTNSFFGTLQGLGIGITYVDATDAAAVTAAVTPTTRMVFVETIANPATQVADLAGIGQLCRERGLVYVLDNTMTTPVLLRGRDVGASLVVHSLAKGIAGHGDTMGGAVCETGLYDWRAYPNIAEAYRTGDPAGWGLQQIRKKGLRDMGATLRAEDAHRIATGAETMEMRIAATNANALAVAQWLERQPQVRRVLYPGLASHPQHERARTLFGGRYGALLAFELRPEHDVMTVLDRLRTIILSSHLSDNRTLAIPVAQTIFWEMGAQRRAEMGIGDGMVRLSVGLEPAEDLCADLAQALRG